MFTLDPMSCSIKEVIVQRFLGVVPHIDAAKRSACIEGLRIALARVKTYWAEMEATTVVAQGSAIGRTLCHNSGGLHLRPV